MKRVNENNDRDMTKCANCDTVNVSSSEKCRFCGHLVFVDVTEEELQQRLKRLGRKELCCPNPACEPLLFPVTEKYCSRCGNRLEKSNLDLWFKKCVEPFVKDQPLQVFNSFAPFIEDGRKMGFDKDRLIIKFEEEIQLRAKTDYEIVKEWISQINRSLISQNSKNDEIVVQKKVYQDISKDAAKISISLALFKQGKEDEACRNTTIILQEQAQGAYIGFIDERDQMQAWVFPAPGRRFTESAFRDVFPHLTEIEYQNGNIIPIKATAQITIESKLWRVCTATDIQNELVDLLTKKAEEKGIASDFVMHILKTMFPF